MTESSIADMSKKLVIYFAYMTTSLDWRLENSYIVSNTEVTEPALDIPLFFTWKNNLSSNKKIRIRRIADEVDPEGGHPFSLYVVYFTKQDSSNYISDILINANLTTQ
jgi:hypothetical protein